MEAETRVAELAQRLLEKVEQAIGELDLEVASRRVKTKTGTTEEVWEFQVPVHTGIVDRAGLKLLTGVLKELQSITGTAAADPEEGQTGIILLPRRQETEDTGE